MGGHHNEQDAMTKGPIVLYDKSFDSGRDQVTLHENATQWTWSRCDRAELAGNLLARYSEQAYMDLTTLLIVVVIILLLGGGWYGRGRWF